MTPDLILGIDQGTTSTRAIAYDFALRPVASAARSITTEHPQSGWFEQDPVLLLESVVASVEEVLLEVGGCGRVAAAGLDNQGETVVAWDSETGRALAPAVLWQCRRSLPIVGRLREAGLEPRIRALSGLPLDPYFSASKMTWLLEEDPDVQAAAARRTLRFGTVDAWLTACLDHGDARTDVSTASRTQLFDLHRRAWDPNLLAWFHVDGTTLPRIVSTAGDLGSIGHARWGGRLPLRSMACDQQAALAGHGGFAPGVIKATLGTGVFVLCNAGNEAPRSPSLEVSIGWAFNGQPPTFVLQGGVFAAGSFMAWLRDDLALFADDQDIEAHASSVEDSGGVRILPAPAGLGAPWWRPSARTVMFGATGATNRGHIARAAIDGIAHLTVDVIESMAEAMSTGPTAIRVDGGLAANSLLIQRLADLSGRPIDVAAATESTTLGIAGLAGIGAGLLAMETIAAANPVSRRVDPLIPSAVRVAERSAWQAWVPTVAGGA